jgi:predicted dehydrogenase
MKGAMICAGYFAQFHAEGWRRIPEAQLVAVADPAVGKAAEFAARWAIPRAYQSVSEMLDAERPEFVDIVTRPETHLELVTMAAERGIHVICQKPMAPTWDESVAMCEIAERNNVRLLIHENWRWQPWYREAKRLIEAGRLGSCFQISFFWRTGDGRGPEPYRLQPYFRTMPRLLVYETLVHLLDTFRYLFGEVASLTCQNRRINPAIIGEDQSLIQLEFIDKRLGLIDGNRITGPNPTGPAMGTMLIEGGRAVLRITPDGEICLTDLSTGNPSAAPSEINHDFMPPTTGYKGDSVLATQFHLLNSLRTGQPSESEGRDYLRTVALVEACYRSVAEGTTVRVQ